MPSKFFKSPKSAEEPYAKSYPPLSKPHLIEPVGKASVGFKCIDGTTSTAQKSNPEVRLDRTVNNSANPTDHPEPPASEHTASKQCIIS